MLCKMQKKSQRYAQNLRLKPDDMSVIFLQKLCHSVIKYQTLFIWVASKLDHILANFTADKN